MRALARLTTWQSWLQLSGFGLAVGGVRPAVQLQGDLLAYAIAVATRAGFEGPISLDFLLLLSPIFILLAVIRVAPQILLHRATKGELINHVDYKAGPEDL